jgi:hypothetical protein
VITVECKGYTFVIDNGKVEAHINPAAYDKEHKMRNKLHDELNDRFMGVQLLAYEPYNLSKASMYRLHANGRRDITIFPESNVMKKSDGTIDTVFKDKDGNIVSDSRRDRIEKKKKLAELVAKHRAKDKTLESILGFYNAAVHDPYNELVHLFDIWEALEKRFNGYKAALNALGISESEYKKLGNPANNDPFIGRHRGKKVGVLRGATEAELEEARSIVRNMIEAYLQYLENQNTA